VPPVIKLDEIIAELDANPDLSVTAVADFYGFHRSVLNRNLRKAGRSDLVERHRLQKRQQTAEKYQQMLKLLDNNPEIIVKDAANKVGLHWNGTYVRKELRALGREDLLLRINATEFKVTRNVNALRKVLDTQPNYSVKQAAIELGLCPEVANRQLRARGFEHYIGRKKRKTRKSLNSKLAKLTKQLRADPNGSARKLAKEHRVCYETFLDYLKKHGQEDLVSSRNAYSAAFVTQVQEYVKTHPKESKRAIAGHFGISAHTLDRWCPKKASSRKTYTTTEKQAIISNAVAQLETHPNLSLSKVSEESPVSFSCLRKWLLDAGHKHLVSRHGNGGCRPSADTKLLLKDFEENPDFTISIAAQKYDYSKRTVIEKLLTAGKKAFINRRVTYDYSDFIVGGCYFLGNNLYVATIKCLVTYKNQKIIEGLPLLSAYAYREDVEVKSILDAWGLQSTQELDNLLDPYMGHYYTAMEMAA